VALRSLFILIVMTLSSCNIKMDMQVNRDYSGSLGISVDISQLSSLAISIDSSSEKSIVDMLKGINPLNDSTGLDMEELEKSAGISDLKFNTSKDKIELSYGFSDINRAYTLMELGDSIIADQEKEIFSVESDRAIIQLTYVGIIRGIVNDLMSSKDEGEMNMSFITTLIMLEQSYTFERPVATIVSNDLPVKLEGNKVSYRTSLAELISKFVGSEIVVVFKPE